MAIFISQVRADIKLDPYTKAPVRQTTATGETPCYILLIGLLSMSQDLLEIKYFKIHKKT